MENDQDIEISEITNKVNPERNEKSKQYAGTSSGPKMQRKNEGTWKSESEEMENEEICDDDDMPDYKFDCLKNSNINFGESTEQYEQLKTPERITSVTQEPLGDIFLKKLDSQLRVPQMKKSDTKSRQQSSQYKLVDPILEYQPMIRAKIMKQAAQIDPFNNYRNIQDKYEDKITKQFKTKLDPTKTLGKRSMIQRVKSETPNIIVSKRTNLQQRRVDQTIAVKEFFKSHKDELLVVEDWLQQLANKFKRTTPYEKIGVPFCDAIILPRCALVFGEENHHTKMHSHFLKFQVPVATISDARQKGFVFLGLDDAKNHFSNQLVQRLKAAIDDLIQKCKTNGGDGNEIFIKQIDYTQDILGFFMSVSQKEDLKAFAGKLGIPYSKSLSQLATCFQFCNMQSVDGYDVIIDRVKIYNKWVHLLTSGQAKWLSMNLKKVLEPNMSFYLDKVVPTKDLGFSRIEVSKYFYSQSDWYKACRSIIPYEKQINSALTVLNSLPQLNYSMSWSDCVGSYMEMIDTKQVIIAFEDNVIGIAYSYSKRSCTFAGHLVDITSKSPPFVQFLKRYGRINNRIFVNGKHFKVQKGTPLMQLPICSLNQRHLLKNQTNLNPNLYKDWMSEPELDSINLRCDDPEFFAIFGGNNNNNSNSNQNHAGTPEQHLNFDNICEYYNDEQVAVFPSNYDSRKRQNKKLEKATEWENKGSRNRNTVVCSKCGKTGLRQDNLAKHQRGSKCV